MRTSAWEHFDWGLLLIAVFLTIIGLLMIYSATRGSEDLADAWRRQAIYAAVGVVVMFLVAFINYRWLESLQWPLYFLTLGLLVFTLFFGSSEIGAVRRFIYIGGTSIQPAFPALVLLIISQASLLARNAPAAPGLQELIVSAVLTGLAALLVFEQPNLSTATLYIATWIAMVFASDVPLSYLQGLGIVGLLAAPIVWANMDDYMRNRIYTFLDPKNDPGAYYNIQQALISIGSGGLMGKGFATGTQSQLHFLRVRHTDFIFSVICEELGFVGAVLILFVFALLLWRLLRIAANAADATGKLIVTGVIAYIFYQLLINLGMNLNVIPVAGLPMPFISSGGSALVITFVGLGLVESVAMRQKRVEF
ncbi:MAG TPA: FtsW/RodA/SpoVE family cell cycle protein [Anaerolineae bacterium]|nr:FtsW/RodA/SpoVE family cell cycle protein [Anaerolineae bacterium]HQK13287.1 FtsW/RodA/SpoVE family cell cycle protein [Anaerolineae bacterium]